MMLKKVSSPCTHLLHRPLHTLFLRSYTTSLYDLQEGIKQKSYTLLDNYIEERKSHERPNPFKNITPIQKSKSSFFETGDLYNSNKPKKKVIPFTLHYNK